MNKVRVLSAFVECSGGATPKVESIKQYARILKEFGYQELYLGMGNGYEMKKYPYFAYKRGRYTIEDMQEMDAYCKQIGITLIPNIQLLGHLGYLYRYDSMRPLMDTNTVLLVGDEKVYELIEEMFKTISTGFSSHRIHISLDEAFGLGTGRYLEFHEKKDAKAILLDHLLRVKEIAKKYDCEIEMWGDGLIDRGSSSIQAKDVKAALPEKSIVWQWDYTEYHKDKIRKMIHAIRENATDLGYAGCAWKHTSFGPNNSYSLRSLLPQLEVCESMGVERFMVTVWEDRGLPVSFYSVLPALYVVAEHNANRPIGKELDKQRFEEIVGMSYDDVFCLEYLNHIHHRNMSKYWPTESMYLGLGDIFITNYDHYIRETTDKRYAALARKLGKMKTPDYLKKLFAYHSAYARYLSKKARLGANIRLAYKAKDNEALEALVKGQLSQAIVAGKKAYRELLEWWPSEYQRIGLETNQLLFFQAIGRLEYAKERLEAYLKDGTPVDEIEGETLPPDLPAEMNEDNCNNVEPAYFLSANIMNIVY